MERDQAIAKLISYALDKELIQPEEKLWAVNALLEALELDGCTLPEGASCGQEELPQVLDALLDDAYARGVLKENSIVYRDLFDTKLMGALTPRPAQVIEKFQALREQDPKKATDWYYRFSQDTNYIRRDRIAKDVQWKTDTQYGELDITINLSKPEKDPKAIAAARNLPASNYPRCQLCAENEGYAGRVNHPARQNHRIVPITINNSPWFLQYSPYVYYNEHCICLNREHVPMKIDRACFAKLLDFVGQFPHYFVGSNADLPIVGGSILAHDHFQGGRYTFAMAKAPVETSISFPGYEDVRAGIVKWPMSVIRLTAPQPDRLVDLADRILTSWRGYTDEKAVIYAETGGEPHNTITPIARRRGEDYELDLVLRNNLTTPEYPLGLYHPPPGAPPHQEGKHRPHRSDGPGGAPSPSEIGAGRGGGQAGPRGRFTGGPPDGVPRGLGGRVRPQLLLHGGQCHGHCAKGDRPGLCPGTGVRRRLQAHTGGKRSIPALSPTGMSPTALPAETDYFP